MYIQVNQAAGGVWHDRRSFKRGDSLGAEVDRLLRVVDDAEATLGVLRHSSKETFLREVEWHMGAQVANNGMGIAVVCTNKGVKHGWMPCSLCFTTLAR